MPISVLVGDKYSNPAAPSAVYFRSTAGVIQGGVSGMVTSKDGQGTVDLISGNPAPLGVLLGTSAGETAIIALRRRPSVRVVSPCRTASFCSGAVPGTISDVTPSDVRYPERGSQVDFLPGLGLSGSSARRRYQNHGGRAIPPPPSEGVKQNQVFLQFGNAGVVELPDVIVSGPGTTQFTCIVSDGSWDIADTSGTPVNVMISVTGPNTPNQLGMSIGGVVH